jgi:phage shock protein C
MKKLTRSMDNRMVAGICGGLGKYFGIDATIIRLLAVVGVFISWGLVLLMYVIAMLIIPLEGQNL